MRKITLILLSFVTFLSFSQRSKTANINTITLWSKMPEKVVVDSILQQKQKEYSNYYTELLTKYENDAKQFQNSTKQNELITNQKKEDLLRQQKRINDYKIKAENLISQEKDKLNAPIKEKMQKAIDIVATKLKYDYVIDSSFGNIIYIKNKKDNILVDVLDHLEIK